MHRQPVFAGARAIGGNVADRLFDRGVCLPSGSRLTTEQRERVVEVIRRVSRG
jgi:dTDP-4-amino-4,6-dideoxygalactose transaminase